MKPISIPKLAWMPESLFQKEDLEICTLSLKKAGNEQNTRRCPSLPALAASYSKKHTTEKEYYRMQYMKKRICLKPEERSKKRAWSHCVNSVPGAFPIYFFRRITFQEAFVSFTFNMPSSNWKLSVTVFGATGVAIALFACFISLCSKTICSSTR